MFAEHRRIVVKNGTTIQTPLLLPSFSSKAFQARTVREVVEHMAPIMTDEVLISAYDLHYGELKKTEVQFAPVVFLDSGGYEASQDIVRSSTRKGYRMSRQWTAPQLQETLATKWDFRLPTVLVSFDGPNARTTISRQIHRAKTMFRRWPMANSVILLKTEKKRGALDIEEVAAYKHELAEFDVIGVTEKELGRSILDRMVKIAKLRRALDSAGLQTPIHVFGSLDAVSSPLYFFAGADIFDGLTWLRYAFCEGNTIYKHSYGARKLGIGFEDFLLNGKMWNDNYYYLFDLKADMNKFLLDHDFCRFRYNSELLREGYNQFRTTLVRSP
jgi:hypothetical protein